MLIDNYRRIHIYENCSADMLSVNFSIIVTSPIHCHYLTDYKGAETGQPGPSQILLLSLNVLTNHAHVKNRRRERSLTVF